MDETDIPCTGGEYDKFTRSTKTHAFGVRDDAGRLGKKTE